MATRPLKWHHWSDFSAGNLAMHLLRHLRFCIPITAAMVVGSGFAQDIKIPEIPVPDLSVPAPAVNPNAQAPAIEVLAKGPVHEGFASGAEQVSLPGPIAPKAPPEQIDELPPDQKPAGDNVVWIPGYWSWDEERRDYIWVSGFWRNQPPGRTWMPGSWRRTDGGYQWTSGFWNPIQQESTNIQYFVAPPAPPDVGPAIPAPVDTSVYVPGNWLWRNNHWAWRAGYWIDYRPGYIWIPAHYQWTPGGYVFIDGYWDYALAERGMLFAPVYYRTPLYRRASYFYTPTVWVRDDSLVRAMFLRRGHGTYYFGDYFGEPYAARGFTAWISAGNVSVGFGYARGFYDPMFSYYRVAYRADPFWNRGITELYVARHANPALRPPTTLTQQNAIVTGISGNSSTAAVQVQNASMLAGIRDTRQTAYLKMVPVSDASRQESARVARQTLDLGRTRATQEIRVAGRPAVDGVHTVQLAVPRPVALLANTKPVTQPTQVPQRAESLKPSPGIPAVPANPIPSTPPKAAVPANPIPSTPPKAAVPANPIPSTPPKATVPTTVPQVPPKANPPLPVPPPFVPPHPTVVPLPTLPKANTSVLPEHKDRTAPEKKDEKKDEKRDRP